MTCLNLSCVNILHTKIQVQGVMDKQPSSSTTGHDFAKSSHRAPSGLFIANINHMWQLAPILLSFLHSTIAGHVQTVVALSCVDFCRVYSERQGYTYYHPSSCFPTHCVQAVMLTQYIMSREWTSTHISLMCSVRVSCFDSAAMVLVSTSDIHTC